jgi:hypothetical protein
MNGRYSLSHSLIALLVASVLIACSGPSAAPDPVVTGSPVTPTAVLPVDTQVAEQAASTPEPALTGYWVQPGVPDDLVEQVAPVLEASGLMAVDAPEAAAAQIVLSPGDDAALQAEWVYALATPFATVPDGLTWDGFRRYWLEGVLDGMAEFDGPPQIVITQNVVDLLTVILGSPAEGLPLQIVNAADLADRAWAVHPAISVLPFDTLSPQFKVLTVDGASVLDKALNTSTYPLTVSVGLVVSGEQGQQVVASLTESGAWPATNRDPARITNLVVTGVTALVRATAKMMESRGVDYPAEAIMPFIEDADILHTSNEVSFAADCPAAEWTGPPEDFCSSLVHFPLLTDIGLDVVELTGNHLKDWTTAALSTTLDLYDSNGIAYYGGGRDLEDARTPAILTAPDGTRIAFVGCNDPGPVTVFAAEDVPGAAACDDYAWLIDSIRALRESDQADVIVATVQYWELDSYTPTDEQVADFTALAEAGADIVSGSQAHQPQGFAFVGDSFVHYGVGNLFFDQMDYIENRQMFADRHVLYEGRHISTVLFTGLMEDYAQPNPMTAEDRAAFLQTIFAASGW